MRFSALIDSIMKGSVQSIRSWTPHHPTTAAAAAPDTELMVVCTADDEPDVEEPPTVNGVTFLEQETDANSVSVAF